MPVEPADFTDISNAQLWDAIVQPADADQGDLLAAAKAHADGKRFDDALRALASWHRAASDHRLQRAQAWANGGKLTSTRLRQLVRALASDADDPGEWVTSLDATGSIDRIVALARHLLATADAPGPPKAQGEARREARRLLAAFLRAAWNHRERVHFSRYPLCGQLGGYSHFHYTWWPYLALVHSGDVEPRVTACMMKLSLTLGRSLYRQAERYIVHNIFTAGSYALLFIARSCPELAESQAWARRAIKWLDLDFDRSFFSDGGHAERNWGYGSHTVRRLTDVWQFARETGGMFGREAHFEEGLRRAYRFYAYTLGPGNVAPGFGDEGLHDLSRVIDSALTSGVFPRDTPRDLGVDRTKSYNMEGTRVAIMRGGGNDTAFATLTYGDYAGWHSHHDLLSFNFWAHGETTLEEVPRFGPYEHPLDRIWRGPEAHNLMLVDGYWFDSRPLVGEEVLWHSDDQADIFSACHRAYRWVEQHEHRPHLLSDNLLVRRTVVFVKDPGYACVIDSVYDEDTGVFNRATSQWWHSPFGFRVLGDGLARTKGRKAVLIATAQPDNIRRMETGVDFTDDEIGRRHSPIHHPMHNQWHHLRIRRWDHVGQAQGMGFATLLLPFVGKVPAASIKPLPVTGRVPYRADAFEVALPTRRDVITLNPEQLDSAAVRGKALHARVSVRIGRSRKRIEIA